MMLDSLGIAPVAGYKGGDSWALTIGSSRVWYRPAELRAERCC